MAGAWAADRRLWLTVDKSRVVEEGDPDAAFLFASPGTEVTAADVQKYDLGPRKPAEQKQAVKPEDKAADPPANKGRTRTT